MDSLHSHNDSSGAGEAGNTRWSLVAAVRESDDADRQRSLREFCARYWVPVYLYIRQCGHSPDSAAQATQAFLSFLVAELLHREPETSDGFRRYVQDSLAAFLTRGALALESTQALEEALPPRPLEEIERRYEGERQDGETPAQAMQRGFALELLARAMERLRLEAEHVNRLELFDCVRPWLSREPSDDDYARLASEAGSSPFAMVIAVKRLRQRFQDIIDAELADTAQDKSVLAQERDTMLSLVVPRTRHE